jgi:hypothetical protein
VKKIILIIVLGLLSWQGYSKYQAYRAKSTSAGAAAIDTTGAASTRTPPTPSESRSFRCDGRIYCSQMTSCAEATFFLKNCPGVKMDGNNDGIPCEKQWCK